MLAVGPNHDDVPSDQIAPCRDEIGQQQLHALDMDQPLRAHRGDAIDALGEIVGERCEVALGGGALLPGLIEHLHEGAEADRDQEGDDQGGYGAAKRRLRRQQPGIGRLRDRLRQSLDRVGLGARVLRMRTRHALDPHRKFIQYTYRKPPRHSRIIVI